MHFLVKFEGTKMDTTFNSQALSEKILQLKKRKNAIVLAHYYQEPEIQLVADFVGDSLGLSQEAARTKADIIVFAGVHFMAETAKIINPGKKVLLPELKAGCSLADSCPPAAFRTFLAEHPGHRVMSYINCSAEIKTMSDVICTSSNAVEVLNSIPLEVPVIFAPDRNLGQYLIQKTGRKLLLWDGACEVHEAFSQDKIHTLKKIYPHSRLVVHPESEQWLLKCADFIGSTAAMIDFIQKDAAAEFIVATEAGILHQMKQVAPDKKLIPAPAKENNSCACSECRFMKMNTLEKLFLCLENESPEIVIDEKTRKKAYLPIKRMLDISANAKGKIPVPK